MAADPVTLKAAANSCMSSTVCKSIAELPSVVF